MTRLPVAIAMLLAVWAGCKDEPQSTQPTRGKPPAAPEPAEPVQPGPAEPPRADEPREPPAAPAEVTDEQLKRLETVYVAVWCSMKRRDREGLEDVYEAHGYDDAAAFVTDWARVADARPEWASEVMTRTVDASCARDATRAPP